MRTIVRNRVLRRWCAFTCATPQRTRRCTRLSSRSPVTRTSGLDWVIEKFLQPLSEVAVGYVADLQEKGVVPAGDPALIYNMIRVSSGGLIALALELKGTANIDLTSDENLDSLADTIVRIFLPGEVAPA